MRMFFVIAILIITATSAFALSKDSSCRGARRSGALVKIKIHVVDDLGHNVSNADVSVFFGMNFRPNGHCLKGCNRHEWHVHCRGKNLRSARN